MLDGLDGPQLLQVQLVIVLVIRAVVVEEPLSFGVVAARNLAQVAVGKHRVHHRVQLALVEEGKDKN